MAIKHHPAECTQNCLDDLCPLVHNESWTVIGDDDGREYGPFWNLAAAQASNKNHVLRAEDSDMAEALVEDFFDRV